MNFESRLSIAEEKIGQTGLTHEIAKFVLEDEEFLALSSISAEATDKASINNTADMFEQAIRGEGLFVDINVANGPPQFLFSQEFETCDRYLNYLLFRTVMEVEFFDGAILACSRLLRCTEADLGPWMSPWLADYLVGKNERPNKPKGPNAQFYSVRNSIIAFSVEALVSLGYPVFRNHTSQPISACDYVSAALGQLSKISLTPDAVYRIYRMTVQQESSG